MWIGNLVMKNSLSDVMKRIETKNGKEKVIKEWNTKKHNQNYGNGNL